MTELYLWTIISSDISKSNFYVVFYYCASNSTRSECWSISPLIGARYLSMMQGVRIFREGKPINRIYIDSIRYPAIAYKLLVRIDRCFRCQQFGHKLKNYPNEPKCGELQVHQRICSNAVKCANCYGQHMARASECSLKISHRIDQQQHNTMRKTNDSSNHP